MRVSTQFPIAVHSLMILAYSPEIRVTSDLIAESAGCNAVIVRNIFSKLKKASLISVNRGTGGTVLAKPPEEISIWDIYTAVESPKTEELFKFHENMSKTCPVGSHFHGILISHLDKAVEAMKIELSGVTLAALVNELKDNVNQNTDYTERGKH